MGKRSLVRALTKWDLTALAVNQIIGAGIFGLPSAAAAVLGAASPIGILFGGVIMAAIALCFAEVAGHFTETGGPYLYARSVFGNFTGFEVGWTLWLARVSGFAANSNLLVAYLSFFVPAGASGIGRAIVLIVVAAVLMITNIRGVTWGARSGTVLAFTKIAVLSVFTITGLAFVEWSRFSQVSFSIRADWGKAVLLLVYAYSGFESVVIPAAEAKGPRRDLPFALLVAIGICALTYVGVQIVAVGTAANLALSDKPFVDSARTFMGPAAAGFISVLVCICVAGNLSAIAFLAPRLTYAQAERGDLPSLFAKLHPAYGTPVFSIIFFTVVATTLAISGTFVWLVTVSVLARLASFVTTCLAVPVLRRRNGSAGLRIPLGLTIPIAAVGFCIWLAAQASLGDLRDFFLACIAGAVLYVSRHQL
jgi:basic amino acid/polyamine antiporter, APA family